MLDNVWQLFRDIILRFFKIKTLKINRKKIPKKFLLLIKKNIFFIRVTEPLFISSNANILDVQTKSLKKQYFQTKAKVGTILFANGSALF
jgi:hypothetical protein